MYCLAHPQVRKMEADVKNLKDNPQTTLLEGLHSVAYSGGLGAPLIVPEGCLGGLNAGGWVAVELWCAGWLVADAWLSVGAALVAGAHNAQTSVLP